MRAQGGVVLHLVAAIAVRDLLERLIEQVEGAAAVLAVADKGALAPTAVDLLVGEFDRQGVNPGGIEEGLGLSLPFFPRAWVHGLGEPDRGFGVDHRRLPFAQTDARQRSAAQGVTLLWHQAQRLLEVGQGHPG